jgi:hypothetical protein
MTPLLAQADSATQTLHIPVSYGGIATIVFGGIVVFFLAASYLLREFQAARTAMVAEVKKELATPAEPQAMSLPQPFTVTPHVAYTPLTDHEELEAELRAFTATVEKRFTDQALASSASRDKIYGLIRAQGEKLQAEMKTDLGGVQKLLTDLFTAVGQIKGEIKHFQSPQK